MIYQIIPITDDTFTELMDTRAAGSLSDAIEGCSQREIIEIFTETTDQVGEVLNAYDRISDAGKRGRIIWGDNDSIREYISPQILDDALIIKHQGWDERISTAVTVF